MVAECYHAERMFFFKSHINYWA